MTIERRNDDYDGGGDVAMTQCPLCGYVFGPNANRPYHFVSEHSPEDVGL